MSEFKLPDVGEGLTEAEIVSWKVKAGDSVEINDIIVEIETAKSHRRAAVAVRRHGARADGRRGPDGRRRHADHLHRLGRRGRRRGGRARRAADRVRPLPRHGPEGRRDAGRPLRHGPLQPGRVRRRRGRVAGRSQQGRARPAAPGPQGIGHAADRRRRPDPAAAAGCVRARWGPDRRGRARRRAGRAGHLGGTPSGRRAGGGARPCRGADAPARRPRAGQAAGAQAGQGPRCRPVDAARLRGRWCRHAHRRRGGRRRWRDRQRLVARDRDADPASYGRGAARDPRADQGRAQDDGPGDEPLGLHQPARDRVDHRRRDRHDAARRAAQGAARAQGRHGSARCWCWPARSCWR